MHIWYSLYTLLALRCKKQHDHVFVFDPEYTLELKWNVCDGQNWYLITAEHLSHLYMRLICILAARDWHVVHVETSHQPL